MYFKQIELHGFKSFADRTPINLEPGITAIVGPNGCGKSNILDALRWALGEQSPKALRGAHMQDVIFNGSEHRPATGMAEVTLVFDNSDGRLPLDFSEVQVTRRIYRSGESEYLINQSQCRLRDVQELFMDTGIGTNAYSLIGQGKIDLVLSSKPDDRRYLFEEAAGIIKYKSRKRVAMRKLDSAEQNLLRLADIIGEVARQMRSLKRQVNAAIRHREITDSLRELEIRNAWLRHNELTGQIADLKERFATTQDTYEQCATETSKSEAEFETLNLRRIELDRVLVTRREGEHQVGTEMEKIESQIALLRKEIDFSREQQERALEEQTEFKALADQIKSTQEETTARATALRNDIAGMEEAQKEAQETFDQAKARLTESEAQVETIRVQVLETLNTRSRAQTELETLSVSLQNIDGQLEGIYGRQATLTERHEALAGQLQQAQSVENSHRTSLEETEEKIALGRTEEAGLNEKLGDIRQTWQDLREEKGGQEARLNSLRELRDNYEGFAKGVKAIMKAKQQNDAATDGVIGPVGDLLSTEDAHRRAIEAALGGTINNIVVETADNAKTAIGYLREHHAGRVTFLPLDTLRPNNRDESSAIQDSPGIIGNAMDFVSCDEKVHPALTYLLANTVVIDTIDNAIAIARKPGRYPKMVTLDGEVVSPSGAITGGRTRRDTSGLLGRSAEIESLEVSVEVLATKIETLAEESKSLQESLDAQRNQLNAFEEQEATHRAGANASALEVARYTTELESITAATQQLGQQRDTLVSQREALEANREDAQHKMSLMENDDEALQRRNADALEVASQAQLALSRCTEGLSDLRVKYAALSQNIEETDRNVEREAREHARALEECEGRDIVKATLVKQEEGLSAGIKDDIERLKTLSETKDEAHTKVLESQAEQQKIIETTEKLSNVLKSLRGKLSTAQKEVHSLELDLSHKEDQSHFFAERILLEYDLALAALEDKDVGTDEYDEEERERLIEKYRKDLQRLGTVNLMAIEEYETLEERDKFLTEQEEDLRKAHETLLSVVERIDVTIREMFMDTFNTICESFKNYFRRLFNGGQARIYLLDEDNPLESGIEIEARPPGKKPQTISLLSGGEQAMTAIALLFSIFNTKPSPFCVLDEVDAPLDDANIGRFLDLVDEFTDRSQFVVITHSKRTMAHADALLGVTQQERGVSQLVSVQFDEVKDADTAA